MAQTRNFLRFGITFIATLGLCYIVLQFSYFIFFVFPPTLLLSFFPLKLWKQKDLIAGIILGYLVSFLFIYYQ